MSCGMIIWSWMALMTESKRPFTPSLAKMFFQ